MFYQKLAKFIQESHFESFKRGDLIYNQGDTPEKLFLVEQGIVGLFHISESGKETFLRIFNKDYIFGHRSYFAKTPYHASAIALTPVKLNIISKSQCQNICEKHPELLLEMTHLIANDLGVAELRLAGLQDKSAPKRIIETLIFLKLKHPNKIWTRKEVAEYAASTYETVTRVMTDLDHKGFIHKDGRDFSITNIEKLTEYTFEIS